MKNLSTHIIIVLIAIATFFTYKFYMINRKFNDTSFFVEHAVNNLWLSYKYMTDSIPNIDVQYNDQKGYLEEFLIKDQLLILRINEEQCSECIRNEINLINQFVENTKSSNVIVLASFERRGDFKTYQKRLVPEILMINTDNVFFHKAEELGIPYYFIIDKNRRTNGLFFPDKKNNLLTVKYFININKNFLAKKNYNE